MLRFVALSLTLCVFSVGCAKFRSVDDEAMTEHAYHVRIDRVMQGPDGQETPADRLSVDREDFLWIYVEAELPSGRAPQGAYTRLNSDGSPDVNRKTVLGPPTMKDGQYRYSVTHYVLSGNTSYSFHFADDLESPTYEARWEVRTR